MRSFIHNRIIGATLAVALAFPSAGHAQGAAPLSMSVVPAGAFHPVLMAGLRMDARDPFRTGFLFDRGDASLDDTVKRAEYLKLARYFLAALTVPNRDMWVNLSPEEPDRIIADDFLRTDMGQDLLEADYTLKRTSARLTDPGSVSGRAFWDRVYALAAGRFGSTDIPLSVVHKVWIVPDRASVYEKRETGTDGRSGALTGLVVKSRLKVMLAVDRGVAGDNTSLPAGRQEGTHALVNEALRETIIPVLEREVNEGKAFAGVRQAYSAMLMATWFKKRLRETLLGEVVADRSKTAGIAVPAPEKGRADVYERYLAAMRQGVVNLVREETDPVTREVLPRRYFAGGLLPYDEGLLAVDTAESARGSIPAERYDYAEIAWQQVGPDVFPDGVPRPVINPRTGKEQPQQIRLLGSHGMEAWWAMVSSDQLRMTRLARTFLLLQRATDPEAFVLARGFLKISDGPDGHSARRPSLRAIVMDSFPVEGRPLLVARGLSGDMHDPQGGGMATETDAVDVMTGLMDALRMAHRLGIVHHDVKPGNVLAWRDDARHWWVKLVDYDLSYTSAAEYRYHKLFEEASIHFVSRQRRDEFEGVADPLATEVIGQGQWEDVYDAMLTFLYVVLGNDRYAHYIKFADGWPDRIDFPSLVTDLREGRAPCAGISQPLREFLGRALEEETSFQTAEEALVELDWLRLEIGVPRPQTDHAEIWERVGPERFPNGFPRPAYQNGETADPAHPVSGRGKPVPQQILIRGPQGAEWSWSLVAPDGPGIRRLADVLARLKNAPDPRAFGSAKAFYEFSDGPAGQGPLMRVIVMEPFLEGWSLSSANGLDRWVRDPRDIPILTEADALDVMLSLIGALRGMHALGIVHNDIKPQNVLARRDDASHWQVQLVDHDRSYTSAQQYRTERLFKWTSDRSVSLSRWKEARLDELPDGPVMEAGQREDVYSAMLTSLYILLGWDRYDRYVKFSGNNDFRIDFPRMLDDLLHKRFFYPGISPSLRELLARALREETAFRTADEALAALQQLRAATVPQTPASTGSATPGGIDFNDTGLEMDIRRDGDGLPLPASVQDPALMAAPGFVPRLLNIVPASAAVVPALADL